MARTLTAGEQTALGTSVVEGAAHAGSHVRFEMMDATGTYQDMTSVLHGFRISTTVDQTVISGTFTVARSYTDSAFSLSPLVSDAVDAGRKVRLYLTTLVNGSPASGDLRLVFDGVVDVVDAGSSLMELQVRDNIGALLADRDVIDAVQIDPPVAGVPLEDVLEEVLYEAAVQNGTASGLDHDIPTNFDATGVAAGAGLKRRAIEIEPQKLLEALRTTADRIGWQLRPRYNETDSEFQLAFYEPPASKVDVDWHIPKARYIVIPTLRVDRTDIRNAIRVSYIDEDGDQQTYGPTATPTPSLQDQDSIDRFGFRFMELAEDETSPVRDAAAAAALANIALNDLAWPVADVEVEVLLNWAVDIDDLVTLEADDVHFLTDQTFAVVGYEHDWSPDRERTRLRLRGTPTGGVMKWRGFPVRAPQPPTNLVLANDVGYQHVSGDLARVVPRIKVAWDASPGPMLAGYRLRWRIISAPVLGTTSRVDVDGEWVTEADPGRDDTHAYIVGVEQDLEYEVELRAVNTAGVTSGPISDTLVFSWMDKGTDLALKNFDFGPISETEGRAWWTDGALLDQVWVRKKIFQKSDMPVDPVAVVGALEDFDVVEAGVEQHTVTLPTGGDEVLIVLYAPMDEDLNVGSVEEARFNGPELAPPQLSMREVVSGRFDLANISIVVRDEAGRGGTLSVWTAPDSDDDGDPDGAADEVFAIASTPSTQLIEDIKKPLSRSKVVYAEFVADDGATSGVESLMLQSAKDLLDDYMSEATAGSVVNWMEWGAANLAVIPRMDDLTAIEGIPDPITGMRAMDDSNDVLYKFDGTDWVVDLDTPAAQYAPAFSAGIIKVEYLDATVGMFVVAQAEAVFATEITAYDATIQNQFVVLGDDLSNLEDSLGDLAYEDLVEVAKLGSTVIVGGFIKTDLIDVDDVIVRGLLQGNYADFKNLSVGAAYALESAYPSVVGLAFHTAATAGANLFWGTADGFEFDDDVRIPELWLGGDLVHVGAAGTGPNGTTDRALYLL